MNISRFFGATSREAMRQVRLALGSEALIISNRRVNGGVEILAADPTAIPSPTTAPSGTQGQSSAPAVPANVGIRPPSPPPSFHTPLGESAPPPPVAPVSPDVMDALGAMRGALEARMDEVLWGSQLRRAPQAVALFQSLLGLGFSTALVRAMIKHLPDSLSAKESMQWARNELVSHLPMLASEDELWQPGAAVALVGPTGVGKTTTLAKLAARCVRRFGAQNIVLITTDTYRIGAHEQLRIYGDKMRVPVHVVQDAEQLHGTVARLRPEQIVLIDNVGVSQRDRYVAEQAAMLSHVGRPVSRLLVLNAASHGDTLDEVARIYSKDGGGPLKGCIVSKVDEAPRLGAAIDTAIRYRLPVCYVSNGQKVPENLVHCKAEDLVDRALAIQASPNMLYTPTEADIAALMGSPKAEPDPASRAADDLRRRQLLPGLLAADGATMSDDVLDAAVRCLDEGLVFEEAYRAWQRHAMPEASQRTLAERLERCRQGLQATSAQLGGEPLLAIHDQVTVRSSAGTGRLRAAVLLDASGRPLASPAQQLEQAQGWLASDGLSSMSAPSAADALRHQLADLQAHGQYPVVHMLEGGQQSLWRSVSGMGAMWLAHCPPTTRIEVDDQPAMLGAHTATLAFRPLEHVPDTLGMTLLGGVPASELAVWCAQGPARLVMRQASPLPVSALCVRLVRRSDGAVLKSLLGLGNVSQEHAPMEMQAAWLIAQSESRVVFRQAARFWALLDRDASSETPLDLSYSVMQLGAAAWWAMQGEDVAPLRRVMASLMGKPELTAPTAAAALMKLFALREMIR